MVSDSPKHHLSALSPESTREGFRVTWYGLIANVALAVLKLVIGFTGRSQALVADGVHSVSDMVSDVVVLLGLKYGRQAADEEHPYGHGRIETLASLVVGVVLASIGIGIAWHAIRTIYYHEISQPSAYAIWVAALSILVKEGMYRYTITVGRKIRSSVLIANAWHHRTDALSSIAVLIGISAAWFNPKWGIADSLAALVVAYLILRVSTSLIRSAFSELVDTVPEKGVVSLIGKTSMAVDGVIAVHDIKARRSGPDIFAELHIVVDQRLTVLEGHHIAKGVEMRLLETLEGAQTVTIHVDPDTSSDSRPQPGPIR